jgi:hypothetical protein
MGGPAAHPETTGSRARTPVEDDPRLSTGSTSTWKFARSRALENIDSKKTGRVAPPHTRRRPEVAPARQSKTTQGCPRDQHRLGNSPEVVPECPAGGLYLEERLFQTRRLVKALAVNTALFACLFITMFFGLRLTTLSPILPFVSGVAVRILQQTVLRSAWFLGTAVPMGAAYLSAGPLWSVHARSPLWTTALIRGTGLTVACYFLTLLAKTHQRKALRQHPN